MKGCIYHYVKWQIHLFISKVTNYVKYISVFMLVTIIWPLEVFAAFLIKLVVQQMPLKGKAELDYPQ